ncbi:MAG: hypothetical protein V3T33_03005 [Myxococcota bacterium]
MGFTQCGIRRKALWAALLGLPCMVQAPGAMGQATDAAAQEAASGEPTWYAESVSRGEKGFLVTHRWAKGARFRSEVVVAGHRIISIVNGEYYYTIDAVLHTGVAIRRSPQAIAADAKRPRPFGNEFARIVEAGGEKVSTKQLGGRDCDLYRLTDNNGRRQVCVDQSASQLPIQVEVFDRATGRSETVDYVSWLSGIPIPDAFFEPDAGIALEHFEYQEYRKRSRVERIGPAPPLYSHLLHGNQPSW